MFGFVKQIFNFSNDFFFGFNLSSVNPLKCISMNNEERKVRPQIVNVNSDEPVFLFLVLKQVNAVTVVIICKIVCS